jgi:hypothetical protein
LPDHDHDYDSSLDGNVWIDLQKSEHLLRGYGGERGIRTLGAAINSTHDFQSCSFGQLGHLSGQESLCVRPQLGSDKGAGTVMAERVGFEPTIPGKRDTAFRERGLQPLGNLSATRAACRSGSIAGLEAGVKVSSLPAQLRCTLHPVDRRPAVQRYSGPVDRL